MSFWPAVIGAVGSYLGGQGAANRQKGLMESQKRLYDLLGSQASQYMPMANRALWNIYQNPNTPFYQSQLRDIEAGTQRAGMTGAQNIAALMGRQGIGNSLQSQNMQTALQGQLGQAAMNAKIGALGGAEQRSTNALMALLGGVGGMAGQAAGGYGSMAGVYGDQANQGLDEIGQLMQLYMMNRKPTAAETPKQSMGYTGSARPVSPSTWWGTSTPDYGLF